MSDGPFNDGHTRDASTESKSTLFWLTAGSLWTIFGLALSSFLLGLAIVGTAVSSVRTAATRSLARDAWVRCSAILLPTMFYLGAGFISSITSLYPEKSWREFASELFTLLAILLVLMWIRSERDVRLVLNGMLAAIAASAVYGLAQYAFTDYGPLWRRIPGPFSHYMTFSGVLLFGVLILLPRLMQSAGRAKWLNWVLLALVTSAMALTLTRHVWVATLAALTIVVWVSARRFIPIYLAVVVAVGVTLSMSAPEHWDRVRSIVDLRDESNYDRLCMLWAGQKMVWDRPIFGLGIGSISEVYPIYRHPSAPRVGVQHLHNTFVQMAAEAGLAQLAAYFWLMIAAGLAGYRGFKKEWPIRGPRSDLYFTTLLTVIVFNLAGLFEANWRDTEVRRLVIFLIAIPWCLALERPADVPSADDELAVDALDP